METTRLKRYWAFFFFFLSLLLCLDNSTFSISFFNLFSISLSKSLIVIAYTIILWSRAYKNPGIKLLIFTILIIPIIEIKKYTNFYNDTSNLEKTEITYYSIYLSILLFTYILFLYFSLKLVASNKKNQSNCISFQIDDLRTFH